MRIGIAAILTIILIVITCVVMTIKPHNTAKKSGNEYDKREVRIAQGTIKKGDTLAKLFRHNQVDPADLRNIKTAADGVYNLGKLCSGQPYKMAVDDRGRLASLTYWVDDENYLNISREGDGLNAALGKIEYTPRLISLGGVIKDNLISSLGPGKEALILALDLSDIFAWDIDFNTDLKNGDTYRIIVEGLFLDNTFKKFGTIIAAEFINNGRTHTAYRFTKNGGTGYYDSSGQPLKKTFLKAPLSFRRISSSWTARRYHPILKRYRPHRGIDYVAPRGAPVSAIGSGSVQFAGYRAGYGKLVIVEHSHNRMTYYGHLSRIRKEIRQGGRVQQGDIVGYVGSTGLATGSHLHFEMRVEGKPVNPLTERSFTSNLTESQHGSDFRELVDRMDDRIEATPVLRDSPVMTVLMAITQEG